MQDDPPKFQENLQEDSQLNPYEPNPIECGGASKAESSIAKPRLWTVFLTVVAAFLAMTFVSGLAVLPFILPAILEDPRNPPDQEAMMELATTPFATFMQAIPAQLAILLTALGAAYLSPVQLRERIGLINSGLTAWEWVCVGVASFVPTAFGMLLARLLTYVLSPDPTAAKIFGGMTAGMAVPWILFIAFAPGFSEEILFRGYLQTRLLERWSPGMAIFVSALLFAVFHLIPHTIVFAFPLGIWFGYIAWKTGSIWPTILAHALINGTWNILNISRNLFGYSETVFNIASGGLIVAGLAALVVALPAINRVAESRELQLQVDEA